jgi:hypothetical protein
MITYYLSVGGNVVTKRITHSDGSSVHQIIIKDLDNTDYQAYLKWLEEGNEPLPADE